MSSSWSIADEYRVNGSRGAFRLAGHDPFVDELARVCLFVGGTPTRFRRSCWRRLTIHTVEYAAPCGCFNADVVISR